MLVTDKVQANKHYIHSRKSTLLHIFIIKMGECKKDCRNSHHSLDVNECVLNEGHGPCQDTCHNLVGGYECSCDGLPGTILSSDNHTCQEAGPCSISNAGCSHTCLSTMGRVFCLCPDGFMLEDDWKTCQGSISFQMAHFHQIGSIYISSLN